MMEAAQKTNIPCQTESASWAHSLTLKMAAVPSSKTVVNYQVTQRHIPEDSHCYDNHISQIFPMSSHFINMPWLVMKTDSVLLQIKYQN
jgi:hypothetical protein